jgi:hypothetical protein
MRLEHKWGIAVQLLLLLLLLYSVVPSSVIS